ncbi:hypothetical protein CLG96_00155 [Sphingomonas oleivorans]|uniref:HK97 gp10 family phage protein n=1 Tax=Sphingomonas oleivorans TaxID=1735121 RepID=A0A2T5G3C8_9SPHN|nr:hypothetical protein [Sphingomonas oleivorans]PTQ13733.1 hypothetical protein CLG96_00155 [Sphingomonas oleivorans]
MARIRGAGAHSARLKRLAGPDAVRRIGSAIFAAGKAIRAEAQASVLAGAGSGAPPDVDAGRIAGVIETAQLGPLKVEISSNAPRAADLEFGTSGMAARPYMRPAAERLRSRATAMVRDAVDEIGRGSGGGG